MKIISGLIRIGSLDEYFAGCGLELSELGGKNTGNPMYTDISLEKLSHSTQQGFLRRKNPTWTDKVLHACIVYTKTNNQISLNPKMNFFINFILNVTLFCRKHGPAVGLASIWRNDE